MLLPHQVIAFLQHDDYDVRAHAADYLAMAHDPSPATADDFWQSIDRFGMDRSPRLMSCLSKLPQTSASLDRSIRAIRDGGAEEYEHLLLHVCERIDFPLLLERGESLLSEKALPPDVRDHLRQHLALAGQSADELWDRLRRHSDKVVTQYWGDFDGRVSLRLVEALARHGEAAAGLATAYLAKGRTDEWMEVFVVQLLGRLRHEPAADRLIELLGNDEADLLVEEAVAALARIGTPAVVEGLERFYTGADWGPRMSCAQVFGRIKRPESEQALLRLVETETRPDLLSFLAGALCDLCTTDGLEAVRRLIVEDRYDPEQADLELLLLTVGEMVGYTPPEADAWRLNPSREKRMRARAERYPALDAFVRGFKDPDASPAAPWAPGAYDEPVRRDAPKVGRNDPCPCGSGKKYKKCCLDAAKT